ncbi:MAG: hypothetical protein JXA25_10585 [Anaerolineales bacterium]|nr:hypothetical protein [Anaerolineales bacterium]
MCKKQVLLFSLFLPVILSGCQEFRIVIEYPESPSAALSETPSLPTVSGPVISPTPFPEVRAGPLTADNASFDPYLYFFPDEVLPQDVTFVADDKKTLLVSYLDSPGTLIGIAHVREYESYPENIFVTQTLIQIPIETRPEMLHTGHFGDSFIPTEDEFSLGEKSVFYRFEDELCYRFFQSNIMVIVDMWGTHPFVTEENLYKLAKTIQNSLPDSFPIPELIESPSLELQSELSGRYLRDIELVTCHPPHEITDPVVATNLGYCFRADIVELILNLKVGIYDKQFNKLVYMKEFLFFPPMGEWITGLFFPVRGYAWQLFHAGEYEALFWVNDLLVEVIPYTLVVEE